MSYKSEYSAVRRRRRRRRRRRTTPFSAACEPIFLKTSEIVYSVTISVRAKNWTFCCKSLNFMGKTKKTFLVSGI